jgi:glycosyltransferase involved in cell wall biosynthesis
MLGWEYPPFISGGLGTACEGLTTALARTGVGIDFVVPRLFGSEEANHMHLIDSRSPVNYAITTSELSAYAKSRRSQEEQKALRIHEIQSLLSPYMTPAIYKSVRAKILSGERVEDITELVPSSITEIFHHSGNDSSSDFHYSGDLFTEVDRYAKNVLALARSSSFDVIHAHDWMTYPAAVALSRLTGLPLILHVHSLEVDRSGENVNTRIHEIERACLQEADQIIAVSHYTRSVINKTHGIPLEKISVVYNGVYAKEVVQSYRAERGDTSPTVLFLGRITFQKGPDYFVEAAARVVPVIPDVKFIMTGTGDMLPQIINRVAELGLTKNFVFTGFLQGEDIERIFSVADLYIMPSVSEPFGISALEAISYDVPVVISRQSGVSEVLNNALKVDFWDIEKLAHFVISVLKYPEIRADIVQMARSEVRNLHWDAAAQKTAAIYRQVLEKKAA